MSYFVRKLDGIEPQDHTVDIIEQIPGIHNDGPAFIGLAYWVHTPGGSGAGAWSVSVAWTDPAGNEKILQGAPISLQDGAAIVTVPVEVMERQTDVSMFEVREDLNGSADGALVSYRIMFTNTDGSDISFFNNG